MKLDQQINQQPTEVRFCKKCVVSNQRPRIVFDAEGVCSACRYAEEKAQKIDWIDREKQLQNLCAQHRSPSGAYDCIVPCSGGKDSSYVAHQLKYRYKMNPLTVTWSPFLPTEVGQKNLQNFLNAGFTNVLATPNQMLHRKLARLAFIHLGDAWQPFAYGQVCFAFHIALNFGIKLVFFGENGEAEYGGSTRNNAKSHMPLEDWNELYFKGVLPETLLENEEHHDETTEYKSKWAIEKKDLADLTFYKPPIFENKIGVNTEMHWFSYYHKWIPQENYYYATAHTDFSANPERSEGTYSKYASLDDKLDGFHYYMAYIKFGIGRATSDAAHEVRDGHLKREEAVQLVRRYDGEFPAKYFPEFLNYLNLDKDYFHEIVDQWRRQHLWKKEHGKWNLRKMVS